MATTPISSNPVPVAVWPCAQAARHPTEVTTEIVRRAIDAYSRPDDLVANPLGSAVVADQAAALGRHHLNPTSDRSGTSGADLTVIVDPTSATDFPAVHELLRPGGVLVVVAQRARCGRRIDPAATVVAQAQQAGLGYLQHVIALTCPVQDGRLAVQVRRTEHRSARWRSVAHRDVLVFAKPEVHHV